MATNEKPVEVKYTRVVVYRPDGSIGEFETSNKNIKSINAGLVNSIEKVVIVFNNGKSTLFLGMPFEVESNEEAKEPTKAN